MTPHPKLQRCSELYLRTEFLRSVMDVDRMDNLTIFQTAADAGFNPYKCIDPATVTNVEKLSNGSVKIEAGKEFFISDTSRVEAWNNWLAENATPKAG